MESHSVGIIIAEGHESRDYLFKKENIILSAKKSYF